MTLRERLNRFFKPEQINYHFGLNAPVQVLNYTAQQLYQTQDNLQAVVNYLANSIAQLPLKVYRRTDENNRERDRKSPAALLIYKPNRWQTSFEFNRALTTEYLVFGAVYVWTVPSAETESGYEMFIVPTEWLIDRLEVSSNPYEPDAIWIKTKDGTAFEVPADEFTLFRTYSPGNPGGFISPISALRNTLQEQIEAGNFRKELWHSSGRLNAQIIRPANVQPWTDETRKKFITMFREAWGAGGSKAGSIPLLEDGMEIKPFQTSFKENQWAESVRLSRETVAAAYGVNPSLIWHTEAQTYASAKDNARQLYSECLGPILQMLQQRYNAFLLPKVGADPNTYVEFDLNEKLKGSFEERAGILQAAVGGPWLTRNEARADNNLPPIDGGDALIVPMNINNGIDNPPAEEEEIEELGKITYTQTKDISSESISIKSASTGDEDESVTSIIVKFLQRQARSVLSKISSTDNWWDEERWNKELAQDLQPALKKVAKTHGTEAARKLKATYNEDLTENYIKALAESKAKGVNESTKKKLDENLELGDLGKEPSKVFEERESRAKSIGRAIATAVATFAVKEAIEQMHQQGKFPQITKTWITGDNPRPTHEAMNGETVPYDGNFSNGAFWVGDDDLGAEETCNCNCSIEVSVEVEI